jgi:ABC-type lipoprotein export system ATPase subunit
MHVIRKSFPMRVRRGVDAVSDPMTLLELDGVERSFEQHGQRLPVLRDIQLRVRSGDAIGIQGHSGSGKSTLLSILGLIDSGFAGAYRFRGHDVQQASENDRSVWRLSQFGLAFQDLWLVPSLTAQENCLVPLYGVLVEPEAAQARVAEFFERARLSGCAHRRPGELSGGERRRVALVRALVNRPPILILDEPTAELDDESATSCLAVIADARKHGATLIVASHDERLLSSCNQRFVLRDGTLQPQRPRQA